MSFDARAFLNDYNIPTFEEGENTQRGWINIQCPCCDDHSNHGGFHLSKSYYNCWRCGGHRIERVIKLLLNVSKREALDILKEYNYAAAHEEKKKKKKKKNTSLSLPEGTDKMKKAHRKYLRKRGFDPYELEKVWDLQGTKQFGEYKYRIIAPIYFNRRLVSYQGRDITDRSPLRYKACEKVNEIKYHKNILYGIDFVYNEKAIIVEGISDAWRLGKGAIATFGTGYTPKQVKLLKKRLTAGFILFDNEEEAQNRADKLGWELGLLGVDVSIVPLNEIDERIKDPGELEQDDADYIRRYLLGY